MRKPRVVLLCGPAAAGWAERWYVIEVHPGTKPWPDRVGPANPSAAANPQEAWTRYAHWNGWAKV